MALKVEFRKSGKVVEWDGKFESILELAEENGIEVESQCREGFCGTCMTRLLSGKVEMETTDGLMPDDEKAGMILLCQAVPKTDIVLDA
jgi:ferredoxin